MFVGQTRREALCVAVLTPPTITKKTIPWFFTTSHPTIPKGERRNQLRQNKLEAAVAVLFQRTQSVPRLHIRTRQCQTESRCRSIPRPSCVLIHRQQCLNVALLVLQRLGSCLYGDLTSQPSSLRRRSTSLGRFTAWAAPAPAHTPHTTRDRQCLSCSPPASKRSFPSCPSVAVAGVGARTRAKELTHAHSSCNTHEGLKLC